MRINFKGAPWRTGRKRLGNWLRAAGLVSVLFAGLAAMSWARPMAASPFRASLGSQPDVVEGVWLAPPKESGSGGESHNENLFKWINFVILAAGLGYLLHKPATEFFAQRSAQIRKELEEGRKALEASHAQLIEIERKLQGLGQEVAEFRAAAQREMETERERLAQVAEHDAERVLQFARAQIEAAARAAELELKRYTAEQAVALAEQMIRTRVDEAARGRWLNRFLDGLGRARWNA